MATTCYWVGIAAGWDDGVVGVNTPWASTSGGSDNIAAPVDGDTAIFDGAGGSTAPTSGPGGSVSLASLQQTGGGMDLTAAFSGGTVNIQTGGSMRLDDVTIYVGVIGAGATVNFYATSSLSAGATLSGSNTVGFHESSVNNCVTFSGSGNAITFDGSSTNANPFSVTGNVTFGGASTNNSTLNVTGTVAISGTDVTNTGAITATAFTITGTANAAGGTLIGPVTISGAAGICRLTITGDVSITTGGNNYGNVVGSVTVNGSGSRQYGSVSVDCTLIAGGANYGEVAGILTAPGVRNANGTIGCTSDHIGSFGTLNLTGIPRPVLGGLI